jgi:zona occludens toxin
MAINAYIGIPGSGKTYEVVHSVILPAFLSGRRVVTNIEGINQDNFLSYVERLNAKRKEDNQIELDRLGEIVKVLDEDVLKDNFFPYKGSSDDVTISKNGDLICLDEVWRIFDESKKIKEEHRSFIAEHRHFVNDKGDTCDLVVISQSVATIPRFIKDRIETTYRMTKLKALGLNQRYRIDVFSGSKTFKTNLIHSIQSKYNPEIFDLYKSYDKEHAEEQSIDGRNKLLNYKFIILKFIIPLLLMVFGCFYLYFSFISTKTKTEKIEQAPVENVKVSATTELTAKERYQAKQNELEKTPISSNWRITGYLERKGEKLVILTDGNYLRYEPSSRFTKKGNMLVGLIDGERVTVYSGSGKKKDFLGGFRNEK